MLTKVTTNDQTTTFFHDVVPQFEEGGVLHLRDEDGQSVYFSPGFWQKAEIAE